MAALLLNLKQPYCIYICAYLCLATLAVVNAKALLQPKPDEIGTLNEETVRIPRGTLEQIEVAALGRPLFPGMLYDCRKDSFILGVTLWDRSSLSENLDSRPQAHTDLKFSTSDSLSSKSGLLDVSASLKTSFLGGLVGVGGSAKYLEDTKSSNQQSRVTMYYSETTRFEQLTMSHLGKITYPEVFDQKTATHVVTAVLYGARAFMVFDRKFSEDENKQQIEEELNGLVNKIPDLSAEGNAALKMTYAEKKTADKITCTFYGDVRLEQNPTTYMEALNLYKRLPSLLKENPQNAVPIKVWLHPLRDLNATAARLERGITPHVAFTIEEITEHLGEAERMYKDLSGHTLVHHFKDIKERLSSFYNSLRIYKPRLLEAIKGVLPAIRGGEMEEKSLEDILKIHSGSPFNIDKINQWLKDAKSELDILSSVTNSLEDTKIVGSDSLNPILVDPKHAGVLCLTFTSLKYEDPYLLALKEFLKTNKFDEPYVEQNMGSVPSMKKWFEDSNIMKRFTFNANFFKKFSAPYRRNNVPSIVTDLSDPSNRGSSVYMYSQGKQEKEIQETFRVMSERYNEYYQG